MQALGFCFFWAKPKEIIFRRLAEEALTQRYCSMKNMFAINLLQLQHVFISHSLFPHRYMHRAIRPSRFLQN